MKVKLFQQKICYRYVDYYYEYCFIAYIMIHIGDVYEIDHPIDNTLA